MMVKSITAAGRKKISRLYLQEMSPTDDSVVICMDDGNCPGCGRPFSDSGRGWGFCRNGSCVLYSKMQRFSPTAKFKSVEEIIKNGCEETTKILEFPQSKGPMEG